jgi:DHA1 family tetracycline resistance protein-like MFS transporter
MSENSAQAHGPRRATMAFIFIVVMLDMLSLGMIMPVLPKLVENFLGGDTARAAEIFGVFGTAWALMQFLFSPVLGALSDRYGRRPVILIANLGLGLDYILMALAPKRRRRSARRALACLAPLSAWASSSAPRSAACSA